MKGPLVKLKLLPLRQYPGVNKNDPIRYYYWPVIGQMYRRRVEICLSECAGGERVLEVGFGTGVSFPNLKEMYQEIHGIDLTADAEVVQTSFQKMNIPVCLRNGNVIDLPYPENTFDTVLLISILEHLQPGEQVLAFQEVARVLKPGGQVVYGVPVERPLMVFMFRLLGVDIREHHFSTEQDVYRAAREILEEKNRISMKTVLPCLGEVYQVGHFIKN